MILLSNKDMDSAFVAKVLQEHSLDPHPAQGFHTDPAYWQENERWRRVVERYSWGAAIFIRDNIRNAGATIIAVGKIDLETGKVSTQGGWTDIQPGWYLEMAMELKSLAKANTLTVPACLGYRVPDTVCDGGLNKDRKIEPVCAWRDRCIAVQEFAAEMGKYQEDVLKSKSPEQIVQMTTRLLVRKNGKVPSSPKPTATSLPAVADTQSEPVLANGTGPHNIVMVAIAALADEVATAANVKVSTDRTRATALPGELFLVDRMSRSDYISLYLARKPKPIALASFRLRPRTGLLVQLPVPKDSPLLSGIVQDDVKEWRDGAFQSAVRDVQTTGVRIEHVKHVILALVQQNKTQ